MKCDCRIQRYSLILTAFKIKIDWWFEIWITLLQYLTALNCWSAFTWGMFDIQWLDKRSVPRWVQIMVHKRMSKQIWLGCTYWASSLHHILLTWNGNCSMGCELWDLSSKVQRNMRRNCFHNLLDLQSHCCSVFLVLNRSYWDGFYIHDIRNHCCCSYHFCHHFCARNQGTPNRGGGEDAGWQRAQLQVLADKFCLQDLILVDISKTYFICYF